MTTWTSVTLTVLLALAVSASIAAVRAAGGSTQVAAATPRDEAPRPGDAIFGEWWTEAKDGKVRFVRMRDGSYAGILTWSADANDKDGHAKKDVKNPSPKLRDRSIIGIYLIWGLDYDDGEYSDGYVYDPDAGKTYRFEAKLQSATNLKIKGYVGISLFGSSQVWTRVR